jgi:hypothetical protein
MASRVHIVLEDDLDGSLADSTVQFAFDGTEYEIDLSEDNLAALRATLEPYISAGRKVGGRGRRRVKPAGNRSAEIRAWAAANGIEVSSRGRIPAGIAAQYDAAHA